MVEAVSLINFANHRSQVFTGLSLNSTAALGINLVKALHGNLDSSIPLGTTIPATGLCLGS